MGSWAQAFLQPWVLFLGNKLRPPRPSQRSQGQAQAVAQQGREGVQRPGRSLGAGARLLKEDTVSLSASAELNPPINEDQRGGPPEPVPGPLNTSLEDESELAFTLVLLSAALFSTPKL